MRTIATSTVAMTAYNALATGTGARAFDEVASAVSSWAFSSRLIVSETQIREAVGQLVRRGFVRELPGRLFDVADPMRRVVVSRDRSDAGTADAGWKGWRVHSRPVATVPTVCLEDVI